MAACTLALLAIGGTVASGAVLPARIEADTVLDAAQSPWELRSDVLIAPHVTVTVEPRVHVVATGDYRLTVSGALIAMAPAGTRIVFRAPAIDAVGAWRGIYFTPGSTGRFQRCTFRSADDNIMADSADVRLYNCHVRLAERDGVYAWGDAFVKTAYCRLQNNGRYGLHIQTSRPAGAVIHCQFVGNGQHPVRVKATCLEMLHGGNGFEANGIPAIGVDCGAADDIEDTDCWRDQALPLDLTVGAPTDELVIASGAVLRIRPGIRVYPPHRIVVRGSLFVDGLPDARVVIQPQGTAQAGQWLGIELEPGALARLASATVGFAQTGFVVEDARLFLSNAVVRDCVSDGIFAGGSSHVDLAGCTIDACGAVGLHLPQPSSSGKVHSTRISNCAGWPARLAASAVEALRHDNRYADNGRQAIGVLCGTHPDITDDDAWLPQGVPFDLTADPEATHLRVGTTGRLSLRPGVEVLGGGVSVAGVLVAAGEPERPVSFGPAQTPAAPGGWTGIEFLLESAGRLVNAQVHHARTGVAISSPGYIRLIDSELRDCSEDGIRLNGRAVPLITGCTVRGNGRWGIGISGQAQPLLGSSASPSTNPGRNCLTGNAAYDLANNTAQAVLAQGNWWGTTDQAEIARHILDRGDNSALGPVNYVPFLQSAPAGVSPTLTAALEPQLSIMSVAAVAAGPGATIHVTLSRPARLRVMVRNIAGRTVRELGADADQPSVIIPWDGRDLRGSAVPAGRYLVEVEALAHDGGRARVLTGLSLSR
ncbi:MAG: right-handed parallel beta-helix repeat-containing protein [Armatimonadota bacterium]